MHSGFLDSRASPKVGVLYAELLGRDIFVFPKSLNHMAAVGEASRLADVRHIVICEKQHVRCLDYADIFDILFAGAPVELAELLGKERVAHVAAQGELLDLERLVRVGIDVLGDRVDRVSGWSGHPIGRYKSFFAPDAQHVD